MSTQAAIPAQEVSAKLPHEREHLDALKRMQTLEPYYRWIYELFDGYVGQRILDAGCGVGNFTAIIAEAAELVVAADLSEENLDLVRRRFADSDIVEPLQVDLDTVTEQIGDRQLDTVVCLDVLEHVELDVRLLRSFSSLLAPGGHVLLKVPALRWLYGSVDRASDHYRRYARGELIGKVREAGLDVVRCRYMNLAGVFPYWLKSRVLQRRTNFSRTFSEKQLRRIAGSIPLCRLADRLTGPPLGQSLVLVAVK